jgi:hypothetical protein
MGRHPLASSIILFVGALAVAAILPFIGGGSALGFVIELLKGIGVAIAGVTALVVVCNIPFIPFYICEIIDWGRTRKRAVRAT